MSAGGFHLSNDAPTVLSHQQNGKFSSPFGGDLQGLEMTEFQVDQSVRKKMNTAIIAASGPSLSSAVVEQLRGRPVIAVNDAAFLVPCAFALVASDRQWWRVHEARLTGFGGARILPRRFPGGESIAGASPMLSNGGDGFVPFNCGQTSGFAAISYALHVGYTRLVLVGFDMRVVDGRRHYFGDHPSGLRNTELEQFLPDFDRAAKLLPADVEILNATPGSALSCFPFVSLEDLP